jgi:phosphoserine phosphatase
MAHIYLIRHGETDYNRRNIVQGGGIDSDLNETGRMQGAAFFKQYGHIHFEKIYCTQLKRTRQTLAGWADAGHEITTLPELNEFGWGKLEGVEGDDIVKAAFEKVLSAWREGDFHARVPDGESPLDAWARAQPGIERVLREAPAQGNVLICAHGRIMRVVLAQLSGYGLSKMDLFPHQNTALNLLSHIPSTQQTDPGLIQGRFRIHKLNDVSHLS